MSDKGATISICGKYRYDLWRKVGEGERRVCLFVMLNPSTADANEDDPTIRRCMAYAKDWGYTHLQVVNLFSFRCTDPKDLPDDSLDASGPDHWSHVGSAIKSADLIVCAWGAAGTQYEYQVGWTLITIGGAGKDPMCLKITKHGCPSHPLYLKRDLTPIPYTTKVTP